MKKITTLTFATLTLVSLVFPVQPGAARERGPRPGGPAGPPPEAYTACEGKSAGDTAEFAGPFGDTVTGTCEQEGDRLVLRPDNPPPDRNNNNAVD